MAYKVKMMVLGPVATNCYILYDESSKDAVIFDPADCVDRIEAFLAEEKLQLRAILLTHGHFDHVGVAEALREKYDLKIYGHEQEDSVVSNPAHNLSMGMGGSSISFHLDEMLQDGQLFKVAGFSLKVFHTPGHTVGGACYYLEEEKMLFSGDTLFATSIGRTDFPGGSYSQLVRSIEDKLMVLPDDVKVFPGHGEQTSIGYEKKYNPFL